MNLLENYQNGVNLGGWISQYHAYDHQHFKTFITEKDIQRIASWGMDHVRLPVDYPVLEDDDKPFVYKEKGFAYIDDCLEWCRRHHLSVIIDLHKAPGFVFDNHEASTLFDNIDQQERFLQLWKALARRYKSERKEVLFELLNEVVDATSDRWNRLAHKAIAAIREIDPERVIVYGSNLYNAARTLREIELADDPNIVYTFHFYEPILFTHQKAPWVPVAKDFNQELDYPGEFRGLQAFSEKKEATRYLNVSQEHLRYLAGRKMDKTLLLEYLEPALEFIDATKKPLYCGEYGVIETAPAASRKNWHRDFVDLLKDHGIGRAVWTYKALDFGLVDWKGEVVDDDLVKIVSRR